MLRCLSLICASLLFAIAGLMPAQAGEASRASHASFATNASAADLLFKRVAAKPCCYNDGEYFNSSPKTCRKYGGRVVDYEYCERQYYNPNNNNAYNYNGKPCCYNSGQFFNSTPSTCRRYGGRVVSQERCDRYYYQQWGDDRDNRHRRRDGHRNDNNYAPNAEKPCCFNRGQYFNSTPKTCTKNGGRVVHQDYCSRQYR